MDNKQSGFVPYCRLYKNDPNNAGKYLCDLCQCEYSFNIDKTICLPNDFFGVQGCNQYQSFGLCKECKWTWQTNYAVTDANPYKAYMNVDLGLTLDGKTCKVNAQPN